MRFFYKIYIDVYIDDSSKWWVVVVVLLAGLPTRPMAVTSNPLRVIFSHLPLVWDLIDLRSFSVGEPGTSPTAAVCYIKKQLKDFDTSKIKKAAPFFLALLVVYSESSINVKAVDTEAHCERNDTYVHPKIYHPHLVCASLWSSACPLSRASLAWPFNRKEKRIFIIKTVFFEDFFSSLYYLYIYTKSEQQRLRRAQVFFFFFLFFSTHLSYTTLISKFF